MKRLIVRAAAFIMTVLLAFAPAAFADLERGDRGDEVYDLQQLLFESGWLFELPDGIFGRNTEAAVKDFEEYAGLPVASSIGAIKARQAGTILFPSTGPVISGFVPISLAPFLTNLTALHIF